MEDELKIELLTSWINRTIEMGDIPKNLIEKISKDDVTRLFAEIKINGSIYPKDLISYRDNLEQRVERERRANVEEELIRMQKKTGKTQLAIIAIMALSAICAAASAIITYQTYSLNLELAYPNIILYSTNCPEEIPIGNDFIMNITVENSGKMVTDIIPRMWCEGDFNFTCETNKGKEATKENPYILDTISLAPNKPFEKSFSVGTKNITDVTRVNNLIIHIAYACKNEKECKIYGTAEYMCPYIRTGEKFVLDMARCS